MKLPRFYPILDTALLTARGLSLVDAARTLLDAGAGILQVRHKGPYKRDLFADCETIAEAARAAECLLVINDRADIARLLNAGLHVGQDDLAPREARKVLGDGLVLGFSTHNEAQMRLALAEPADYLAFGPVFPTLSKENPDPVVGVAQLRRVRAIADRPLVAIGGITRDRAGEVLEAGADSIAVIGDLYPEPLTVSGLARRAAEWMAAAR